MSQLANKNNLNKKKLYLYQRPRVSHLIIRKNLNLIFKTTFLMPKKNLLPIVFDGYNKTEKNKFQHQ